MLNSNALRKLDMQDLMVFVSVYEQRNLTLVAEALHVSQSTVSYCLKKLRANFEDDLFICTRNGMRPTRKALAMHDHVQQILRSVNLCHDGLDLFDPTRTQTTFTVCAPEYFELLVLPHLMRDFAAAGFSVTVNVQKLEKQLPAEQLNDGRFDLVLCFGPGFHRVPDSLISQVLMEDDLVCVMDSRFAPLSALIDTQTFVQHRHVYPTPWTSDTNMVDGCSDRVWSATLSRGPTAIGRPCNCWKAPISCWFCHGVFRRCWVMNRGFPYSNCHRTCLASAWTCCGAPKRIETKPAAGCVNKS